MIVTLTCIYIIVHIRVRLIILVCMNMIMILIVCAMRLLLHFFFATVVRMRHACDVTVPRFVCKGSALPLQ